MNALDFPGVRNEQFECTAEFVADTLTVVFSGTAENQVTELLEPLLTRAHQEAIRLRARCIRMDFHQLRFMSSSSFKHFIAWITVARQVAGGKPYTITFMSNPSIRWQRASLAALSCFAADLITIEAMAVRAIATAPTTEA